MKRNGQKASYEIVEILPDGQEIRRYENGDLRNQNGHMIQPIEGQNIITHDTARSHHKMRKDKILQAIESRLQDVTKMSAPAEAIAAIVGKRAEIAMKDKTRTGNEAAKIVLGAVDAYQDKQETRTNVLRNEYAIDTQTVELLERIAQARSNRTNVLQSGEDGAIIEQMFERSDDEEITTRNNT